MTCSQNVLLVGAGTSSMDIAREIGPVANNIYQVSRGGAFDFSPILLPKNAIRIGSIESFEPNLPNPASDNQALDANGPIPGTIVLKSGQRLSEIHRIILCTGYHFCLPFLRDFHEDDTAVEDASDTVLVTDGTQLHNLHEDIFYIPDPTLAFVGVPFYTATFTLFEFQAMALAAVWSARADLPNREIMQELYTQRTKVKGLGRNFHSLKGVEDVYVRDLMVWLNRDAQKYGAKLLQGHSEEWHAARTAWLARNKLKLEELERERDDGVQISVQKQAA
jgi:ACS family pantothenate transporter-like MFS transporter